MEILVYYNLSKQSNSKQTCLSVGLIKTIDSKAIPQMP